MLQHWLLCKLQYIVSFFNHLLLNIIQDDLIEAMKRDEIKFTSSDVWHKRSNPARSWAKKMEWLKWLSADRLVSHPTPLQNQWSVPTALLKEIGWQQSSNMKGEGAMTRVPNSFLSHFVKLWIWWQSPDYCIAMCNRVRWLTFQLCSMCLLIISQAFGTLY